MIFKFIFILTLMGGICGGVVAQSIAPKPLNLDSVQKSLEYPDVCKEKLIQGKVHIKLLVDVDGLVINSIIRKSPDTLISTEVINKTKFLRFLPGINNGKPVRVWVNIPFDFKLKGVKPKKEKKKKN